MEPPLPRCDPAHANGTQLQKCGRVWTHRSAQMDAPISGSVATAASRWLMRTCVAGGCKLDTQVVLHKADYMLTKSRFCSLPLSPPHPHTLFTPGGAPPAD